MAKYRVTLTADEQNALEKLVSVGKAAARKLTHGRLLLLANTTDGREYRDDQIVQALGTSLRSVERIRKRFVTEGLEAALNPKPQPARPDKIKIKGDLEQHLVRIACSDPPEGRDHWTLQLLADALVMLGLVASLSTETVRQALKKTRVANLTRGQYSGCPSCSFRGKKARSAADYWPHDAV
jgi:transposase